MKTMSLSLKRGRPEESLMATPVASLRVIVIAVLTIVSACTPTIKVEAPSKPIEINLNVKIEHEIRIKVEKDLEELFEEESDIF